MKRNSKTYLLQVAETHDGDDGDWKKAIGRQQKLKLKLRWPWRSVAASGHPARPFRSIVPSSCHSIVIITYIVVSHAQRIFYARTVAYAYTSPRIRTRRHAFRQQGNESENGYARTITRPGNRNNTGLRGGGGILPVDCNSAIPLVSATNKSAAAPLFTTL